MTTQNHLYVPLEIAKLLKEKGFDEPCMSFYGRVCRYTDCTKTYPIIHDFTFHHQNEDIPIAHKTEILRQPYNVEKYGGNPVLLTEEVKNTNITLAPTIQEVVQWLYEKYNLFITVTPNRNGNTFTVDIFKLDKTDNEWYDINDGTELVYSGETVFEKDFTNPIDAYNDAIDYVLEKII